MLKAKARRRCDLGDWHGLEEITQFFDHPHELYRAAKAFYEKYEKDYIEMEITMAPDSVGTKGAS
jgi:hypothetical protein